MTVMEWLRWKYRGYLDRLPKTEIGNGQGDVFFWRYDAWKPSKELASKLGLGGLYIHEFMRSDNDRCPHDHPWWFITFVWGGYWEETSTGRHWRRTGSLLYRPANFAHRIELEPGRKAWSLVLVGVKSRDWGFYTPKGWERWVPGYSPICEIDPPDEEPRSKWASHELWGEGATKGVEPPKPPTIFRHPIYPFKPGP